MFLTRAEVKQPFERVGLTSCEGEMSEEAGILNAMLYRAADMGADGLILEGTAERLGAEDIGPDKAVMTSFGWAALVAGSTDNRAYRATAIKFLPTFADPPK